jgi:hypothetical protein
MFKSPRARTAAMVGWVADERLEALDPASEALKER